MCPPAKTGTQTDRLARHVRALPVAKPLTEQCEMHKCYLVQGKDNHVLYAIFHSPEDAKLHQQSITVPTRVLERTLFTAQANYPGFNQ